MDNPRVSVVIPVHNNEKTIGECLSSLMRVEHPNFEIIVLDDESGDRTAEICATYPTVKLIRLKKQGPSAARNFGIGIAGGTYIAFTDGDCVIEPNWLTELESCFTCDDIAGAGGDQKSPDGETPFGRLVQDFLKAIGFMTDYIKNDGDLKETDHNPSCNSMYRKSVLLEVGGFDPDLWPGEDVELDLKVRRLGYKLIYNPKACVGHYRPDSYAGFAGMMRRYGASQRHLVRKYGLFRKIHYVPVILFFILLTALYLIALNPIMVALSALPFPTVLIWFYLKTRNIRKSIRFTALFMITLLNWNMGFILGK